VSGMNGNLAEIDTSTIFGAQRHCRDGQRTDNRLVQRRVDAPCSSYGRNNVAELNGSLADTDKSTIFEAQRHGRDVQ
jgi:hypothetical protein